MYKFSSLWVSKGKFRKCCKKKVSKLTEKGKSFWVNFPQHFSGVQVAIPSYSWCLCGQWEGLYLSHPFIIGTT